MLAYPALSLGFVSLNQETFCPAVRQLSGPDASGQSARESAEYYLNFVPSDAEREGMHAAFARSYYRNLLDSRKNDFIQNNTV